MDIVERMREEAAYWLSQARESFEEGEFEMEGFTLEDIASAVETRLDYLSKIDLGDVPYQQWLECYNTLVHIRQTQALEQLNASLATIAASSHWLERISMALDSLDANSLIQREK